MPRAGLTTAGVVETALAVVDADGIDALTLAAVAQRAGVAAPSLYKHVGSVAALRTLVAQRVLDELTARLTEAVIGRSRDDAIGALMRAMRAYVTRFPARYAAMPANPLGNPALAEAGARLVDVALAVLRGYGLEGSDAIHATRCLRAIVHGFCVIEADGGFGLPAEVDETYERLIRMFIMSPDLQGGTP